MRRSLRRYIGRNRQSPLVRAMVRASRFVLDAHTNASMDGAENGEAALVARLAPATFTIALDVGANVGDWTIEALRAWPQARVHAFEVAPETARACARRVEAAGVSSRITLSPCGLSDSDGTATMYYFPDHPDLTCDMPRHEGRRVVTFEARMQRGDAYLAEVGIAAVDFLKVDVEGAEHRVLEGLRAALDAQRIHCIQFEYGAFATQTRVLIKDFYDRLGDRYWIGKLYPSRVEFADYDWTLEGFAFANFIAISRARPDLRTLATG